MPARDFRTESDSMGEVQVAADRYSGPQTERSRDNFKIGVDRFQWGRGDQAVARHPEEVRRPWRTANWANCRRRR